MDDTSGGPYDIFLFDQGATARLEAQKEGKVMDTTQYVSSDGVLIVGNIVCPTSAASAIVMSGDPSRLFPRYDNPRVTTTSQPRSTSMMQALFSADVGELSLTDLMTQSAFAKMVAAEFEGYGLDVPKELMKRQRTIGREIQRAIDAEIERLDAEEKELQKREERQKDVREKKEKLQRALRQ